jgi:hypothetical protein
VIDEEFLRMRAVGLVDDQLSESRVNVADASSLTFMSAHPAGDAERRRIQAKDPCAALGLAS